MTPEFYLHVCDLFDAAAGMPSAERGPFLDGACGGDAELRDEVERMLAADRTGQWLRPVAELHSLDPADLAPEAPTPLEGRRIGPYQVRRLLGTGGMGAVYLAARVGDFDQLVALKLIRRGMEGDGLVDRFRTERQVLAGLSHPHIARLLDGGTTSDGLPYFVMEYIDGRPLDRYCDEHRLATPDRVRLFLRVCDAVRYAHKAGVLHRDLKPGNVLVTSDGAPKVVDFGLAKRLVDDGTGPGKTRTGAVLGTPSYMAPEQAAGKKEVGPAVDVYALGAVLYELLTGRPPFRADTPLDTLFQVLNEEPVPPSRLQPKLARDLETICLKCLEKEPRKRYAAVADLADDLGRFLAGEPIHARPVGTLERGWRWCRRNPAAAALSAVSGLAAALFVAGLLVSNFLIRQKQKETQAALVREQDALADRTRALEELQKALLRAQWGPYFERVGFAHRQWKEIRLDQAEKELDRCPAEQRGWEWHHVDRLCHAELRTLRGHTGRLWTVAYCPDGRFVASSSEDKTVRVWDAATGKLVHILTDPEADRVAHVVFSPDSKRVASAGQDGAARVWDTASGKLLRKFTGHVGAVMGVSFSPDGKLLATAGDDRTVRLWDPSTGKEIRICRGHTNRVFTATFSPDGRFLVSASVDKTVRVWDPHTGTLLGVLEGHVAAVSTAVFSRDGKRVLTAGYDTVAKVWDWQTNRVLFDCMGHTETVNNAVFSPDESLIVTCADDKTVRLWDARTGGEVRIIRQISDIMFVVFSPNGKNLATAGWDGVLRIWDATVDQDCRSFPGCPAGSVAAAFHPIGTRLVAAESGGVVRVCDHTTGIIERTIGGFPEGVTSLSLDGAGSRLAVATGNGTVQVRSWPEGGLQQTLRGSGVAVRGLGFSPDGAKLATAADDGSVRVWVLATGETDAVLRGHTVATAVCFSPDGTRLASGGEGAGRGELVLWELASGAAEWTPRGMAVGPVRCLTFSPNGLRLVTGGERAGGAGEVRLWDVRTGLLALTLRGHESPARAVSFTPDGLRLLSAARDGGVRMWDASPLAIEP